MSDLDRHIACVRQAFSANEPPDTEAAYAVLTAVVNPEWLPGPTHPGRWWRYVAEGWQTGLVPMYVTPLDMAHYRSRDPSKHVREWWTPMIVPELPEIEEAE